jgi:hypothetical protein
MLFMDIYSLDTPTTLIQQVHTLGSENFTKTYQQNAPLERESYLIKYDTALLTVGRRGSRHRRRRGDERAKAEEGETKAHGFRSMFKSPSQHANIIFLPLDSEKDKRKEERSPSTLH